MIIDFWHTPAPRRSKTRPTSQVELPSGKVLSYRIKTCARSKHLRLKISPRDGLTVVVSKRARKRWIEKVVRSKRDWIAYHVARIEQLQPARPTTIELAAIGESWKIEYAAQENQPIRVRPSAEKTLLISGDLKDDVPIRQALATWIRKQANQKLIPWLEEVSRETGYSFSKATIRSQRSCWGSCSRKRAISLNYQLLFLKPELVRCVLVHELCHTLVMKHSPEFWELVRTHDPEFRAHRKALRAVWGQRQ